MSDLTVLMSVFNGDEAQLRSSIDSIINQTYKDYVFLIINDGSNERTTEILNEAASRDSRLKVVDNVINQGLIYSLNLGLKLAETKWVARMDADDISNPERLDIQLSYLKKHPNISVLGCAAEYIENGRRFPRKHLPCSYGQVVAAIPFYSPFCHPGVVFNLENIRSVGGYPKFNAAEDYGLWAKLLCSGEFIMENLPQVLLKYRKGGLRKEYKRRQNVSTKLIQEKIDEKLNIDRSKFWKEYLSLDEAKQGALVLEDMERKIISTWPVVDRSFLKYTISTEKRKLYRQVRNSSCGFFYAGLESLKGMCLVTKI